MAIKVTFHGEKCDAQSFIERSGVFVLGSRRAIWIGIGFELKTGSSAPAMEWGEELEKAIKELPRDKEIVQQ